MANFTLPATTSFESLKSPSHKILYIQLNAGAPQTLLFCYGAGDRSITMTLYQDLGHRHPQLSLICVDRWTLPTSYTSIVARSGREILSELTSITIELLDSLNVQNFSIAAHSAGAYPMLHLANSVPQRVQHLFPICTHIPSPFNRSWILSWLCSAPTLLFDIITKLDSGGTTNPTIERVKKYFGSRETEKHDEHQFIHTPLLQELLEQYRPSPEQSAAAQERQSLDYRLVYSRLPEVDNKALVDMYMSLRGHSIPTTWFTSYDDAFFGPSTVKRLIDAIGMREGIEIVVIDEAKHSNIHFRADVWNKIHQRMTGSE